MTDQERRLAEALRDLCGWHVGMVTADGNTVFRVRDRLISLAEDDCGNWLCSLDLPGFQHLPDLDSPANWGHWLAWAFARDLSVEVVPQMPRGSGRFAVSMGWNGEVYTGRFAWAFLSAFLSHVEGPDAASLPPSVLAWWEHEQGEGSDG